jgi:TetR/AcrR family transcriptional regulator, transcriptional repressor for nem operon
MARTHIDKRSRLVSAAVGLAYQNGFGATSLADIAREAEVPLGNVYYYFKTKDDIGDAVVELRLAQLSAQRQRWNEAGSPKDRLCACVQGVFENKDFLAQRGCAVGTFCSELHKAGGSVASLDREPVSGTREGERLQRPCRAPACGHARRFDPGSCLS